MSIAIDVSAAGVRLPIAKSRVAGIARNVLKAERVRHALLSITFVSADQMRTLNRRHLRRHRPTDVIAFGFDRPTGRDPVVGDVYVAPAVARENAKARGIPAREEVVRLVIHGTLHAIGYDHPEQNRERSRMWKRQERLVRRLVSSAAA